VGVLFPSIDKGVAEGIQNSAVSWGFMLLAFDDILNVLSQEDHSGP
jgi:hypothetical protein